MCIGNYWNIWNSVKCPLKASLHQAAMGGGQIARESGESGTGVQRAMACKSNSDSADLAPRI